MRMRRRRKINKTQVIFYCFLQPAALGCFTFNVKPKTFIYWSNSGVFVLVCGAVLDFMKYFRDVLMYVKDFIRQEVRPQQYNFHLFTGKQPREPLVGWNRRFS